MGACSSSTEPPAAAQSILTQRPVQIQNFKDKAREWNLTAPNIELAFEEAQEDGLKMCIPLHYEDAMRLFLYGKRVLSSVPATRQASIKLLFSDKMSKAYERLKRIVLVGETSTDDANAFTNFVSSNPTWGNDSWVVFRDHSLLKNKPSSYVERIQSDSGLSYMHGAIVLQHYLVAMQLTTSVGMVDIVRYLRQEMGPEELKNHIVHGFGESSLAFLRHLFPTSSLDSFMSVQVKDPKVTSYLETYGPALVTGFGVRPDFRDEKSNVYVKSSSVGEVEGNHALVLVGYRQEQEEVRFLLQNWWSSKPFVEVNVAYLAASGAHLTFSTVPRLEIPASFAVNSKKHVEAIHDVRERHA
jgi:hypothetical protein